MATSKAIGTGKNAATSATRMMPLKVTGRLSGCAGNASITTAPRIAPRIISGKATRKTYQKLFKKERPVWSSASVQVCETTISIGHAISGAGSRWREATAGAKTKINSNTVASLSSATDAGNRVKVMARTTTLSAGDENMAARTDSTLIPEA